MLKQAKCHSIFLRLIVISSVGFSQLAAADTVANPTVTGPIVCDQNITCTPIQVSPFYPAQNVPQTTATIHPELSAAGYTEREYFIEGNATGYTYPNPADPNTLLGLWNLTPNRTAAYKTRILVRVPTHPNKFNGTVLVEWANVTGGSDVDYVWSLTSPDRMSKEGMAYVLVSAQYNGVYGISALGNPTIGLKQYDASRYSSLSHPGDDYSFDIFSQATQAVLHPSGIDPMNGLKVKKVIATGYSQSAQALVSYINGIQSLTHLFNGFLISDHFCCGLLATPAYTGYPQLLIRQDVDVPVLNLETENAIAGDASIFLGFPFNYYSWFTATPRQPETNKIKNWEIAGASHVSQWSLDHIGLTSLVKLNALQTGCTTIGNDGLIHHYVSNAALHVMNLWVNEGKYTAASPAPLLSVSAPANPAALVPDLAVDLLGNAIGGIRNPLIEVPIALQSGIENGPISNFICIFWGTTQPFSDTTLKTLYPNHGDYVSKTAHSVMRNVKDGFLLIEDGAEILKNAGQSTVGK